jgi:lysophospholipase L1-like esterase
MNIRSFSVRTFVLLVSLTLTLSFHYKTIAHAGPCPDGTIAIWSLEESGYPYEDWINPSSNNAICDGECPARINDGVVTAANRFNNNGSLRVPNGAAFNWTAADSFSIELWVRNSGAANTDQVLMGRTDGTFSWNISLLSNGTIGFGLNDSTNSISLTGSKVLSTPQSSLGVRWHHVAVVRNGDSGATRLFVDGEVADSVTQAFGGGFTSDSASLAIGWSGDSSNPQRFSGDLDEAAVYGHPLTRTEIRSHYYLARHYCELYDFPVNIMPLGNSITFDRYISDFRQDGERTAYRYPLWQSLTQGMYLFEFVGNRRAGFDVDPAFDPDNAGFPAISAEGLFNLLQTSFNNATGSYEGVSTDTEYLRRFPNDVILLHIGTNGVAVANAGDVVNILDHIDGYSTNVTVVVARIIHNTEDFENGVEVPNNVTHQFNNRVQQIVTQRTAAGDKLLLADMEDGAGLVYVNGNNFGPDMEDNLHPSTTGYGKMAAQWYVRLQEFLPQVVLPEITSAPVTEAAAGQEYQYQVTAGGSPSPQFSLTTAPDGMTIDENSGLITWTASDTIGETVNVSVRARQDISSDDAGWLQEATQNFSITIVEDSGDGDGNGDGDGDGNNDSSSGGCFIQSTLLDIKTQPFIGGFGLLMLAGLIGTLHRKLN